LDYEKSEAVLSLTIQELAGADLLASSQPLASPDSGQKASVDIFCT